MYKPQRKAPPTNLRKSLFYVIDNLIKHPADDSIYDFTGKKQEQANNIYITAEANNFLRIFYGCIKEYLSSSKNFL